MNFQYITQYILNIKSIILKQNKKMLIVTASTIFLIIIISTFSKQEIIKAEKVDFYTQIKSIQEFGN